jgi:2-polyprenyl-3-methyl-5-hydroxy-6-metoxy-1,4-benzoquinol methylase
MTDSTKQVREYFNREAERFDAIYESNKPVLDGLIDRLFRGVILERYRLVCNLAPMPGAWSVLDVGCGSGRYAITLAKMGAKRVVGMDLAKAMIDMANADAKNSGLSDRCEFVEADYLDYNDEAKYDAILAMGYFDYLKEPLPHLWKMYDMCQGRIFASFPKRWEFRAPTRKLRFALERGYVRFYSQKQVLDLCAQAGLSPSQYSLIDLGRDWILVAQTEALLSRATSSA